MTIEQMKRDYIAQGGTVKRIAQGKRAAPRKVMRDLTRDDNRRLQALALWAQYRDGKVR